MSLIGKTKDGFIQFDSDTSKATKGYITVEFNRPPSTLWGARQRRLQRLGTPQPGMTEEESNEELCHYPDPNSHSNRCWNETGDANQSGSMQLAVDLNSDDDAFPEYNKNSSTLTPERNGCQDPDACNYDDHATDDYPMFTGWDHLGVSADSRFFITREAMTRAEAETLATAHGCTLAQLNDENEALMVGFKPIGRRRGPKSRSPSTSKESNSHCSARQQKTCTTAPRPTIPDTGAHRHQAEPHSPSSRQIGWKRRTRTSSASSILTKCPGTTLAWHHRPTD